MCSPSLSLSHTHKLMHTHSQTHTHSNSCTRTHPHAHTPTHHDCANQEPVFVVSVPVGTTEICQWRQSCVSTPTSRAETPPVANCVRCCCCCCCYRNNQQRGVAPVPLSPFSTLSSSSTTWKFQRRWSNHESDCFFGRL